MIPVLRQFLAAASGQRPAGLPPVVSRIAIPAILFLAASLKTHQVATEPILATGLLQSRWFVIGVIEFEFFLAFWLVSGWWSRTAWWVAVGTFAVFAAAAFGKGLAGHASCGCFGRLPTSPRLAIFIDLTVLVALCSSSIYIRSSPTTLNRPSDRSRIMEFCHTRICIMAIWLATGTVLLLASLRNPHADGRPTFGDDVGDLIVVDPDLMLGRTFELGKYIDIGQRLARGRWLVVFYRAGCPDCESLLARWPELIRYQRGAACVAFVRVPPDRLQQPVLPADVSPGALRADKNWLVTTPLASVLNDNRVIGVGSGLLEDPQCPATSRTALEKAVLQSNGGSQQIQGGQTGTPLTDKIARVGIIEHRTNATMQCKPAPAAMMAHRIRGRSVANGLVNVE